ncbi:hypothetical protein MMC26_002240 [Xylographa opegraphella]|nr:hypothetical protein [Xylographa opegraphella]
MSKASIIIVPSSFALPELYDSVVNAVAAKGYEIQALHLPTVGLKTGPKDGAPATMYEDAEFIAKEVDKLADEGKDVILIAHSYGGIPATECIKGLGKEERQKNGKKGGVVALAYMTALVPAVGVSAMGVLASVPPESQLELPIDGRGWMYHDNQISRSAAISFSDLPPQEREAWTKKLVRHSAISFSNESTYAGYIDVPVSWLLCEDDLCVPPDTQEDSIDLIEKESGEKVDVTSIKSGHFPNISKPHEVVQWILNVARKA